MHHAGLPGHLLAALLTAAAFLCLSFLPSQHKYDVQTYLASVGRRQQVIPPDVDDALSFFLEHVYLWPAWFALRIEYVLF